MVVIGNCCEPLISRDSQYLIFYTCGQSYYISRMCLTECVCCRKCMRIVGRQPVVIIVVGDGQITVCIGYRWITLVSITMNCRATLLIKYSCSIQSRFMRFISSASNNTGQYRTIENVIFGETPFIVGALFAVLTHG